MFQRISKTRVSSFLFMAVPTFAVNALVQRLFGEVDYQMAIATALILGAFWAVFVNGRIRI